MFRRLLNKIESIYKYRYFSRNEEGAYNFLLKKVYKSTDVDFLENIWKLDYYREILEPQRLELDNYKKVLVLAPHQDDETIGCGGTLLKLLNNNCNISIGFLTNGAELSNPTNSISVRKKEAKLVCNRLQSNMMELGIDNIALDLDSNSLKTLKKWLNEEWDAVFTVWPLDQPPKHRLCSYLVGKALEGSNYQGDITFYSVHTDLLPNFYVDISDIVNEKQSLISIYASQLKSKRYDHISKGLDAWRSRLVKDSNDKKYIETFMKIPVEAYKDFQNIYDKANPKELFKGNKVCMDSFRRLKKI